MRICKIRKSNSLKVGPKLRALIPCLTAEGTEFFNVELFSCLSVDLPAGRQGCSVVRMYFICVNLCKNLRKSAGTEKLKFRAFCKTVRQFCSGRFTQIFTQI
jgi:hypothetical protein